MSAAGGSSSFDKWFDGLAIGLSTACLLHCLALPLLIALIPAWSSWLDLPESFHLWMLLGAFPVSTVVLWFASDGLRKGRLPFALGMAGLGLMTAGATFEDWAAEAAFTSLGAVSLASAHILNWRRRAHCHR